MKTLYLSAGYSRMVTGDGSMLSIEEVIAANPTSDQLPMLLIDRLAVEYDGDEASRLADWPTLSRRLFSRGRGVCRSLSIPPATPLPSDWISLPGLRPMG